MNLTDSSILLRVRVTKQGISIGNEITRAGFSLYRKVEKKKKKSHFEAILYNFAFLLVVVFLFLSQLLRNPKGKWILRRGDRVSTGT